MSEPPTANRLTRLELLPRELLSQILDYLSHSTTERNVRDRPSLRMPSVPKPERDLRNRPSLRMFSAPNPANQSLKCLSLVSKSLRYAVAPALFKHCCILQPVSDQTAKSWPEPFSWLHTISELADFLARRQLGSYVQTLTLCIEQPYPAYYRGSLELEGQWFLEIEKQWRVLLPQLSALKELTILASPYCLGALLSIKLHHYLDEALYMPYHLLVLERQKPLPTVHDIKTSSASTPSILTDIPWTSVILNEGSFLRYLADNATGWENRLLSTPGDDHKSRFPAAFCERIESFEYIASFPPPWHIIDCIDAIKSMKYLKRVRFQVVQSHDPEPDLLQRGFVSFDTLAANCHEVYQAIFRNLILTEASDLVGQTPSQHLKSLHITPMHLSVTFDDANSLEWQALIEEAKRRGWQLQEGDQRNEIMTMIRLSTKDSG